MFVNLLEVIFGPSVILPSLLKMLPSVPSHLPCTTLQSEMPLHSFNAFRTLSELGSHLFLWFYAKVILL